MSTLATNAITDASGGNTATINGYTPTMSNMAGRNRLINSDMRIDQRNAGASVTPDASGIYTVDRWKVWEDSDGAATVQQVTEAPSGFVNSLKWTTTTADGSLSASQYCAVGQLIEGFNTADLAWGTSSASSVTLSFWVRSSLTGTFGGTLTNGASTFRAYPFTYTISSANTWEQKSITIAGDTSGTWATNNSAGIRLYFGLGVGSTYSGTAGSWANGSLLFSATGAVSVIDTLNATWQITGVQLEAGSVATPFEHRQYGQELALCQRYFISYGGTHIYERIGTSINNATNYSIAMFTFPVEMRAAPTFGYSAVGDFGLYDGQNVIPVTGFSGDAPSIKVCTVGVGVASGLITKYMSQFITNSSTTARVTWSAEL